MTFSDIYGRYFTKYLHGTWSLFNNLMIFGIKEKTIILTHTMNLSESHSHIRCRQPQSPDPSHLSSDHLHLLSLINTPINSTRTLTLIVLSMVHYTDPYQTPYTLTCVCVPPRLSSDSPKDIPGLPRFQRSSSIDLCSSEHPDSTLLWTRRISVPAPADYHPHDTHQLITLLIHCISLNKHSCVILTCCLLALIVTVSDNGYKYSPATYTCLCCPGSHMIYYIQVHLNKLECRVKVHLFQ